MKVFFLFTISMLILLVGVSAAYGQEEINGELVMINGFKVLRIWGTPYEMGYAHGYLTGHESKEIFDEFVLSLVMDSAFIYNMARSLFDAWYEVPEQYIEEIQGGIDGAKAAGVDLYSPILDRTVTVQDVALVSAQADVLGLFGCSSLIAWGEATENDPQLKGDLAIVRNLDWMGLPLSDPSFIARKTIIMARTPDDRRQIVNITFPGFVGCLSCMNDQGVSVVQHQSNSDIPITELDHSEKFVPINAAMADGMERFDVDSDEVFTVNDPASLVSSLSRSSAYIINTVGPLPEINPPFALEVDNQRVYKRYAEDDPDFPPTIIATTNHFRKLPVPEYDCGRYETIRTNVEKWNGEITLERLWENNGDVAASSLTTITAQTMIFIPSQRRIGLAYSDQTLLSTEQDPTWFDWDELFGQTPDDTDDDTGDDAGPDEGPDSDDGPDEDDEKKDSDSDDENEGMCCGC